jgi:hypothetical protein
MTKRGFKLDDAEWVAWPSGDGAYGTGACGLGNVEAVHFANAESPDVPVFEALVATGTFEGLFDEELIVLLRGAKRVVDPAYAPEKRVNRRALSEDLP